MAPANKRSRGSAERRNKKARKHFANSDEIYKCIDNLCGEECDQDVLDVMDTVSENSDDDYDIRRPTVKTGRVVKTKAKKVGNQLPLKICLQKAQRYICEALEFGKNTGYLTPKDSEGKVLILSPDLLRMTGAIKDIDKRAGQSSKELSIPDPRHAVKQQQRKQRLSPDNSSQMEVHDDDVSNSRSSRRQRSQSRGKRYGKRGASKRSHSKRMSKKRAYGRSRSINNEDERNVKQMKSEEQQQDAMEENDDITTKNNEGFNAEDHDRDHDHDDEDAKSSKSTKSTKSMKQQQQQQQHQQQRSSDNQGDSDEKKGSEDDYDDDDGSSVDEDKKK